MIVRLMRHSGSFPTCDTCNNAADLSAADIACAQRDTVVGHTHQALDADFAAVLSAYVHHM